MTTKLCQTMTITHNASILDKFNQRDRELIYKIANTFKHDKKKKYYILFNLISNHQLKKFNVMWDCFKKYNIQSFTNKSTDIYLSTELTNHQFTDMLHIIYKNSDRFFDIYTDDIDLKFNKHSIYSVNVIDTSKLEPPSTIQKAIDRTLTNVQSQEYILNLLETKPYFMSSYIFRDISKHLDKYGLEKTEINDIILQVLEKIYVQKMVTYLRNHEEFNTIHKYLIFKENFNQDIYDIIINYLYFWTLAIKNVYFLSKLLHNKEALNINIMIYSDKFNIDVYKEFILSVGYKKT